MKLTARLLFLLLIAATSCILIGTTVPGQMTGGPSSYFPIGVFEDGNLQDADSYAAMVGDLKAHNLDTALLGNTTAGKSNMLSVSDRAGFNTIFALSELYASWWDNSSVPEDIATARSLIYPLVDALRGHPSLKGYYYVDEPGLELRTKMMLAQQAFSESDPTRPAFPILIGPDRVGTIYKAVKPPIIVMDVYPFGASNPACDTAMTGFGYPTGYDMVDYIRDGLHTNVDRTPFWLVLQTHRFGNAGSTFALRQPTVPELREEYWLAIGEGAKGIFWFIYSSEQGWVGLKVNRALFNEVSKLAQRTRPLTEILASLHKSADQFSVTGSAGPAYASTLTDESGNKTYAVVVNRQCSPQNLVLASTGGQKQLKDLETGQIYLTGSAIPFAAGDGEIFEVLPGEVVSRKSLPASCH